MHFLILERIYGLWNPWNIPLQNQVRRVSLFLGKDDPIFIPAFWQMVCLNYRFIHSLTMMLDSSHILEQCLELTWICIRSSCARNSTLHPAYLETANFRGRRRVKVASVRHRVGVVQVSAYVNLPVNGRHVYIEKTHPRHLTFGNRALATGLNMSCSPLPCTICRTFRI